MTVEGNEGMEGKKMFSGSIKMLSVQVIKLGCHPACHAVGIHAGIPSAPGCGGRGRASSLTNTIDESTGSTTV